MSFSSEGGGGGGKLSPLEALKKLRERQAALGIQSTLGMAGEESSSGYEEGGGGEGMEGFATGSSPPSSVKKKKRKKKKKPPPLPDFSEAETDEFGEGEVEGIGSGGFGAFAITPQFGGNGSGGAGGAGKFVWGGGGMMTMNDDAYFSSLNDGEGRRGNSSSSSSEWDEEGKRASSIPQQQQQHQSSELVVVSTTPPSVLSEEQQQRRRRLASSQLDDRRRRRLPPNFIVPPEEIYHPAFWAAPHRLALPAPSLNVLYVALEKTDVLTDLTIHLPLENPFGDSKTLFYYILHQLAIILGSNKCRLQNLMMKASGMRPMFFGYSSVVGGGGVAATVADIAAAASSRREGDDAESDATAAAATEEGGGKGGRTIHNTLIKESSQRGESHRTTSTITTTSVFVDMIPIFLSRIFETQRPQHIQFSCLEICPTTLQLLSNSSHPHPAAAATKMWSSSNLMEREGEGKVVGDGGREGKMKEEEEEKWWSSSSSDGRGGAGVRLPSLSEGEEEEGEEGGRGRMRSMEEKRRQQRLRSSGETVTSNSTTASGGSGGVMMMSEWDDELTTRMTSASNVIEKNGRAFGGGGGFEEETGGTASFPSFSTIENKKILGNKKAAILAATTTTASASSSSSSDLTEEAAAVFPTLEDLSLVCCEVVDAELFRVIPYNFPTLQELRLPLFHLPHDIIRWLLLECDALPHLRSLTLGGVVGEFLITQEDFEIILPHIGLHELSLHNFDFPYMLIYCLSRRYPNLANLDLRQYTSRAPSLLDVQFLDQEDPSVRCYANVFKTWGRNLTQLTIMERRLTRPKKTQNKQLNLKKSPLYIIVKNNFSSLTRLIFNGDTEAFHAYLSDLLYSLVLGSEDDENDFGNYCQEEFEEEEEETAAVLNSPPPPSFFSSSRRRGGRDRRRRRHESLRELQIRGNTTVAIGLHCLTHLVESIEIIDVHSLSFLNVKEWKKLPLPGVAPLDSIFKSLKRLEVERILHAKFDDFVGWLERQPMLKSVRCRNVWKGVSLHQIKDAEMKLKAQNFNLLFCQLWAGQITHPPYDGGSVAYPPIMNPFH